MTNLFVRTSTPLALALLLGFGPCMPIESETEEDHSAVEVETGPISVNSDALGPWSSGSIEASQAAQLRAAYSAYEDGDHATALTHLDALPEEHPLATTYIAWKRAEGLNSLDRRQEARESWARIPIDARLGREALLARARSLHEEGRPHPALKLLESFPLLREEGPEDSVHLRAELLRGQALLARSLGGDRNLGYQACARVWSHAGGTSTIAGLAMSCMSVAEPEVPEDERRGLAEITLHARGLGIGHANSAVIDLLGPEEANLEISWTDEPSVACRGSLELGRAWHKKRKYSRSTPLLRRAATGCPESPEKIRASYLLGQSLQRGGKGREASSHWRSLADAWPDHRFADDGMYHAGEIALQAGRLQEAREAFTILAERFPQGDMVPAGLWGMAWAAIESGNRAEALSWLNRQAKLDSAGPHFERVLQARYWQARLGLDEAEELDDSARRSAELNKLSEIALGAPFNWYGLLAYWKVAEVDGARGSALRQEARAAVDALRAGASSPASYLVERDLVTQPGFTEAGALLRAGMTKQARKELLFALGDKPHNRWSRDSMLYAISFLEATGATPRSHRLARKVIKAKQPGHAPDSLALWHRAFPLAYSDEIQTATAPHPFPNWLFQGLVREESAFNANIKSWAGAMGLSQLMWGTAKESARKMGIGKISRKMLGDPALNLRIGTWYLARLFDRWDGHAALAIGSYNAGPGAEARWVRARGSMPLDAYVETIPFKQTRLYTKHVYASYQTYYALYGEDLGPFVPLRVGPVKDAIDAGDPGQP